jgi:hypothetical protein
MIKHVALFQFRKGLGEERIAELMNTFHEFVRTMPGLRSVSWGRNNSPEGLDKGFMHGFVMEIDDAEAREDYLNHPDHVTFAEEVFVPELANGRDSIVVFDYDV